MQVSPIIRITINKDLSQHDLFRVIYLDERLRKNNGKYYKRSECYKRLNAIRLTRDYKNLDNQSPPKPDDINQIATAHQKRIIIWNMPNYGQKPEILLQTPYDESYTEMNIVAPFFNEPNDFLLLELHLIIDIEQFKQKLRKHKEGNIFECLAWSKLVGDQSPDHLSTLYGGSEVNLCDENIFIRKLSVGFEIFMSFHRRKNKTQYQIIHRSRLEPEAKIISLEYVGKEWSNEKSLITLADKFILRPKNYFNSHPCPTLNCSFYAQSKSHLVRHLKSCTTETQTEYKQRKLSDSTVRNYCIDKGLIPPRYHQRNFCTFDIESIGHDLSNENNFNRKTSILNVQRVISISISKSFGDRTTKVITRDSMQENDYHEFIRKFMTYLLEIAEEFFESIPSSIRRNLNILRENLLAFKNKERNYSFSQIKDMTRAKNYLENLCRLRCYGYNSSKYDLPCLFPGLLNYSDKYRKKISVLKRGNSILSLTIQGIIFADVCNFTSGCSLDAFTRMWGADTNKAIFPYDKFKSIESLKSTKSWPDMLDFKSLLNRQSYSYNISEIQRQLNRLKNNISIEESLVLTKIDPHAKASDVNELTNCEFPVKLDTYVDMWIFYENKIRSGEMKSMFDYLKYYNSLDTISLVQAFDKYIDSFLINFNCNPNDFITLPGLAEQVMWSKFNSDNYAAYTFSDRFGHINRLIRQNLMGGLSCVFARHIEVGPVATNFNQNVTTAPNGQRFDRIVAMDANNLYGHAMRQNLPNGPGVCYERKTNGLFDYKSMLTSVNFSIESIRWLSYMNNREPFIGHKIHHALNTGEKKILVGDRQYNIDGYCVIDGAQYFFEYNGCRYHACTCETSRKSKFIKKDDYQRHKDLNELGNLIVMKECEWYDFVRKNRPVYPLPNFFGEKNIREEQIFSAIKAGKFYGLIQCDIFSPNNVIEHFSKLNHPPIFNHVEIEKEMLSSRMIEDLEKRNIKFPLSKQLSLTFHAEKYLLTTDLARFYFSKGMILSNLQIAIEYNQDQPLASFVNLVTERRKDATRLRDNNLQNTYKLCMNSCYGKTGLNLDKLREYKYVKPEKLDRNLGPLTQQFNPVCGEFETNFIEVTKKKHHITDSIPVHFSFTILQNAKLHMLRFIDMLINFVDTNAIKLLYTDTDSVFLSMTKPIQELVYEHKLEEWNSHVFADWFVRDPTNIDEIREPGLFKDEALVKDGSFVALSSKCYSLKDNISNQSKQATKGIRQSDKIHHEMFLSSLYENEDIFASQTRMNFAKNHGTMAIIKQRKRALNNIFTKLDVQDDLVSIQPLKKNARFI